MSVTGRRPQQASLEGLPAPVRFMELLVKRLRPLFWVMLAGVILMVDYVVWYEVIPTVLLFLPVALASWFNGRAWGLGLAISVSLAHLGIELIGPTPMTFAAAAVNSGVVVATFSVFAVLIDLVAKQRAELRVSLTEKELLLKEVHHRVKNNLQVISSLLSLESEKIKSPEASVVFKECRDRIHLMARLHQRLYSNGRFASVDFSDHIREMAETLVHSHSPAGCTMNLQVQANPMIVDLDMAITLGLIANEVILNSLKHAFTGRPIGTLTIGLNEDTQRELVVCDDGNGLPPEFEPKERGSLGFELIHGLSRQINGEAKIENSSSGGICTTIRFPKTPTAERQSTQNPKGIKS
jgi:two-component sensor histidine kinase